MLNFRGIKRLHVFVLRKHTSKCKGNGAVCHLVTVPRAKPSVQTQRSCNHTVSPGLCPTGSSSRCLCPVSAHGAARVEPRQPQPVAQHADQRFLPNRTVCFSSAKPQRRCPLPPAPPAPRWGCPDHRRACPQPRMGPAAVTVQAESQRFGNLRFVVTSRFLNLLRVNWILQWEFLGGLCGARLGPASAGRPVCGCRAAGNVF